ncbi:MAG: SusC/RagA family TonB-linked outer membrane protein [Muribaculaceae bacterium]
MKVSGTVYSSDGHKPVIGATVLVKGTKLAVASDIDGNFVINNVPAGAKSVVVSYVGMKKAEQAISPSMEIVLTPDSEVLDEVMVVAYGTAKKSSYAGSASLVKGDALKDMPITTFENALTGKVAGLQVTSSSGQAGSAPSIRIRGNGSMNASNEPLYVIDGVPVVNGDVGQMSGYTYSTNNVMNSLNPEDIESISVLKDAAASSLYGSRAANGVVLITTKKGKQGRPVVALKASVGFTPSWATKNYEAASTQEQVNMLYTVFHDYRTSNGRTPEAANEYALSQLNKKFNKHGYQFSTEGTGAYENVIISEYNNSGRANRYFDWDDAYFRTAVFQTYDLSVSGANDRTNYYTSLSYTKDDGRVKTNSFDRISGRVNVTQKVGKWLDFGTNVSLSRTAKSGYNDTRSTGANLFMQTRNLLWGLYWPTDYSTGEEWTSRYGSYAYNSLYYNKEWENESVNNRISAVETLTLHLYEGLDLKSIFSYDNTTVKDHIYYSANHFSGAAAGGEVHEMRTVYEKIVSSTTANYNNTFGLHSIGLLAGFEAEKNTTDFTRASGEGLPTSTLHTVATAGTVKANAYNWGNSMVSLLSKVDYNWNQRYFFSASLRRDGSSRLSPDTRWGNFWSVAGAWRIITEPWMQDATALSDLRVRLSYGVNGTLPTNNYGYINLMSYTNKYLGNPGGTITTMANSDLSWETSYTTNVGIDFGFLSNRLRGTIEYFDRKSKDLLQDVPISTVTGFSSVLSNIGEINNHGFEIEINGDIISNKNLIWSAGINASILSSKVKKLYNGADIIWYDPTGDDDRAMYLYREGESTLAFYGYEWAGVDPNNGKSVYYVNEPGDPKAGDFEYNGRGATYDYDNANYTIIGNAVPKISGGFNTSVNYRGIDLGLNFIYKLGGKIYDGAYKDVADDGYYWERIRAKSYYDNMWTPTNTSGTQPALSGNDLTDAMQYSSRHIHSANFLRLKNLSIGYHLPKSIISKAMLSSAHIFFNATNLLTFAAYKEADPEVNSYGTRGWETPIGKTFTFGIDLKF